MAAVKIMDWNLVRDLRGRHMEDPVKEVSAMQYICTDGGSPNVRGTLDVMSDEQYLYSFMPFCSCGELFGYVERDGRFSEPVARFWFRQLLNVSFYSFLFEMHSSVPTFYIHSMRNIDSEFLPLSFKSFAHMLNPSIFCIKCIVGSLPFTKDGSVAQRYIS